VSTGLDFGLREALLAAGRWRDYHLGVELPPCYRPSKECLASETAPKGRPWPRCPEICVAPEIGSYQRAAARTSAFAFRRT